MEDQLITARIKALMIAAYTMAAVIIAITGAMVVGLFTPNDVVDNEKVFGLLGYVMTSVISAVAGSYATLMGMKGEPQATEIPELAQSSKVEAPVNVSVVNDLDDTPDAPPPASVAETYSDPQGTVFVDTPDDDDDDDDMEPWEKYRGDLRYDANGDGVVDELDFPDWRNPNK
jgi:hypothetical protein